MLTATQRKRLAEEMRGLALECIDNGPRMKNAWCGCAIGISLDRADLLPKRWRDQRRLGQWVENRLSPESAIVSRATCERLFRDNPTAVVFPLLAWRWPTPWIPNDP